ncbi:MAG: class I SAM-dependent methyltransferase [Pseudomonadota bacterium]
MTEIYHSTEYFDGAGYSDYDAQSQALRKTFRNLIKRLQRKNLSGGSLLEIGCAKGHFLHEAGAYFDRTVGTEYSQAAAEIAAQTGTVIHTGGIESIERDHQFDRVVAFHVFEHVYEPRPFLTRIAELLKPGGHVLLAVPPFDSSWRKVLGSRWPSWKFPEHVVFYDRNTWPDLMRVAGFKELRRITVVY